ncbi:hypothetical protein BE04_47435 [Sorangium cellulosum]|uniref:Uncharacterized protein n=2 Tax=Sorangium cellulosum TaxID=56 RepID=A0A150P0T8_SORCE|nr:hypothetical protein SCE1572_06055 [Sorangium cellulosum So0157-2]KYF48486.1 hypothetical protein BE04_47435 [Sorangium cellulosum]
MAATAARSSIEHHLATVPVDGRAPADDRVTEPVARGAAPPAPLVTEPLFAGFTPRSALPWPPPRPATAPVATAPVATALVATAPVATAPLPPAPIAPQVATQPIVIEVLCPPVRRAPRPSRAESPPRVRAVAPHFRQLAVSWLIVASIAAFFGMVAALLMRWWVG